MIYVFIFISIFLILIKKYFKKSSRKKISIEALNHLISKKEFKETLRKVELELKKQETPQLLEIKIKALILSKKNKNLINICKESIEKYPYYNFFKSILAKLFVEKNNIEEAIKLFNSFKLTHETDKEYLFKALLISKNTEKAKVILNDIKNKNIYFIYYNIYSKKYKEALGLLYKNKLKINISCVLFCLINIKEYSLAEEYSKKHLNDLKDEDIINYAIVLQKLKKNKEIANLYKNRTFTNINMQILSILHLISIKQFKISESILENALDINENNILSGLLMYIYIKNNKFDLAININSKSHISEKCNLWLFATGFIENYNYKNIKKTIDIWELIAIINYKKGNHKTALRILEQLLYKSTDRKNIIKQNISLINKLKEIPLDNIPLIIETNIKPIIPKIIIKDIF